MRRSPITCGSSTRTAWRAGCSCSRASSAPTTASCSKGLAQHRRACAASRSSSRRRRGRELAELDRKGVVGIRLNLVGLAVPRFDEAPWPALLKSVADLGWQVEVHREAKDLEPIVAPLLRAGVTVVVDHFGRPDARLGVEDPGFRYLLTAGAQRRTFVKVSAAYRNGKDGAGEATALKAYPMLRDALGLDRLVWGSDWPHTQFEAVETYKKTRAFLGRGRARGDPDEEPGGAVPLRLTSSRR